MQKGFLCSVSAITLMAAVAGLVADDRYPALCSGRRVDRHRTEARRKEPRSAHGDHGAEWRDPSGDPVVPDRGLRRKVPGLNIVGVGGFGTQLVVRGLTTGVYTVNSSTAAYVDETPYSSNGAVGLSAFIAPNLDGFDMQRIEVLKGPQGTLYGANALGGLVKYVTDAPDPANFASGIDATLTSVDGGGSGHNLHGMVNLPLSDKAALRLVAYDNDYPGYVDDPSRNLSRIN